MLFKEIWIGTWDWGLEFGLGIGGWYMVITGLYLGNQDYLPTQVCRFDGISGV